MLNEFKTSFFGGTRSNRFLITGNIPFANRTFTPYHVRATILPQVMSTTLTYDFFGRKFHYPGEKQYATWVFTVLDDTGDKNLWHAFQTWQNKINNNETNVSSLINQSSTYKANNWTVNHLDMNDENVLKTFILYGCWPTQVGQLSLNMSAPNSFASFQVMIVFDQMEIQSYGQRITNR